MVISCVTIVIGFGACTEDSKDDAEDIQPLRTTYDLSADIDIVGSAERFAPTPTMTPQELERIARAIEEYENNRSDLIELNLVAEGLDEILFLFGDVFSYGLITFLDRETSLFGFMNRYGEVMIPAIYRWVSDFSEGLAAVAIQYGDDEFNFKCGFINTHGELVIPFYYTLVFPFSEGLAAVRKGEKWGFINMQNEVVIPIIYDRVGSFIDGYAVVRIWCEMVFFRYGVIDMGGNVVVPIEYDFMRCLGGGLFAASIRYVDENGNLISDERGVIDAHNNIIIPFSSCNVSFIDDQFIIFTERTSQSMRIGMRNSHGEIITPAIYRDILFDSLHNYGVVFVQQLSNNSVHRHMYTLIDINGNMLTEPVFFDPRGSFWTNGRFSEGLVAIQMVGHSNSNDNGASRVYINAFGEVVITLGSHIWHHEPFKDGVAEVRVMICYDTVETRSGLIDRVGDIVLPTIYHRILHLGDGLTAVQRYGVWNIYEKISLCP